MNQAKKIGAAFARVRNEKNLSQEVVSSFASIGRTHLSMIENGQRQPSLNTFFKLCNALGIKPSEMMKRIETSIDEIEW